MADTSMGLTLWPELVRNISAAVNIALQQINIAVGGFVQIEELATGDHTLTASQQHNKVFEIPSMSTDRTLTFAAAIPGKTFIVDNAAGGHSLTVKVNGQTGVTLLEGQSRWLFCDSTDIRALSSATP